MVQGIRKISSAPSAYSYPLLIKQLLLTPILYAPDQEIVYQDKVRLTYREFYKRIHRLASGLKIPGRQTWRHGCGSGLGFTSLPGMLLRCSNDGRHTAYG